MENEKNLDTLEEEIKLMINTTQSARDKAFVSMLYESGCRIAEILTLKLKDIQFDKVPLLSPHAR